MFSFYHIILDKTWNPTCNINGKLLMDKSTSVISRSLPWGTLVPTSLSSQWKKRGNSAHNQATQSWPMLTWTAQPHNCNGSQHLKNTKTGRIVSALGNEHIGIQISPCQRAFFGTSCIQGTAKRTMLCLAWCFLLMLLIPDIWGHVTNKGHASPCLGEYMNPPLNLFGNELVFRWF